jgi:hypothetical protein
LVAFDLFEKCMREISKSIQRQKKNKKKQKKTTYQNGDLRIEMFG